MKPIDHLRLAADALTFVLQRDRHGMVRFDAFKAALADRTPDGYPGGGDPTRGSGHADPIPSVVAARTRPTLTWSEVEALCIEVHADARRLAVLMSAIATTIEPAARCAGMGMAGYDAWGDPTCQRNAVHLGLCDACYTRSWRWQRKRANAGSDGP